MNIHIICLGSLKEDYLKKAQEDLLGKILRKNRVRTVRILEIREVPLKDNASEASIRQALETEAREILDKIPKNSRIVCLDILGKKADVNFFASLQQKLEEHGEEDLSFIIGGSHGLSDEVKKRAHDRVSFSRLTYPHQLFRVALLEAIALYL